MSYRKSGVQDASDKLEAYLFAICKLFTGRVFTVNNEVVVLEKQYDTLGRSLGSTGRDIVNVTSVHTGVPLVRVFTDEGKPCMAYGDDVEEGIELSLIDPVKELLLQLIEDLTSK